MHPALRNFAQILYANQNYKFWLCQVTGWGGYALVTFLSITLIDDNISWPHIGHISLSAALGILTTWPLRTLYRATFELALPVRLVVAAAALVILSGVWTVLRIQGFAWIATEPAVWEEVHYWYFGSLFVFLSWSVLYYAVKYYEMLSQEHKKLLEESALKKDEQFKRLQAESAFRNAQLQMLRYQLNPHFLFNALNSINALVKLKENDKAQEMLQFLSEFLRHSLDHSGIENVSLEDELNSLMLYLNIEKTRFGDRLNLEFSIEPQARQALVPPLILQPIVENSMKYAVEPSASGGTVKVAAVVLHNELQLDISDTGPGMSNPQSSDGRGVGLRNTLDRLETLYEDRYTFKTLDNTPSGLLVQIRFPFQAAPLSPDKAGVLQ